MKLNNMPGLRRAVASGFAFILPALLIVACNLNTQRERTTATFFDDQFTLGKGAKSDMPFTFQNGDSAGGWFLVSDTLKADFLVLDTHDLRTIPHDSAHARFGATRSVTDSFQVGFPVGGDFTFEFINRDTTSPRTIRFRLVRIYWVDVTGK